MNRIGVLYLAPWLTVGGSDRNTIDWCRWIDRDDFEVFLATTQESPNQLFDEAAQHADEAWALPELMSGTEMPAFLSGLVRDRGIDVVHVMNSRLGFDLLPALKRAFPNLVTIAQLHAEEHPEGTGYPRYVAQRYDSVVDGYSVISTYLCRRLMEYGVAREKVHILGLGVDTDRFDPARVQPKEITRAGDELHILFPARLTWQKDPLLVVEIARRLRATGSEAVIHAVGGGDLQAEMEAAIRRDRLEDRVLIHGFDLDMPRWYAATDVMLLPSRYEGIPLTIYESMSMARPVVAAAVGAISELVDESIGFLVRRRDDPDEFVKALLRLEADPALRKRMGAAGRRRAIAEFPVRRVAEAHTAAYKALMHDAPASRPRPDLSTFEDWWADDTTPLLLGVQTDPPRAMLCRGDAGTDRLDAYVRVGRLLTRPLTGTEPLTAGDGSLLGFAFTSPLPGMVDLQTVLPGHLAGLWRAVSDTEPPPLTIGFDGPAWVDAPYLLPEVAPIPATVPKRRRSPRARLRARRAR